VQSTSSYLILSLCPAIRRNSLTSKVRGVFRRDSFLGSYRTPLHFSEKKDTSTVKWVTPIAANKIAIKKQRKRSHLMFIQLEYNTKRVTLFLHLILKYNKIDENGYTNILI